MRNIRYVIPYVVSAIFIVLLVSFFVMQIRPGGSTRESRELKLRELSKLDGDVYIKREIKINGYIVSGYSCSNNKYGLAIFEPQGDDKYKFQTSITRENGELVFMNAIIKQKSYNLFWANKADLDYAEITYIPSGMTGETVKLDAKDNVIIYTEAPAKDFSVKYCFVDKNGNRYE